MLFIAAAQGLGSDIGIVIELESIVMLQIPSVEKTQKKNASLLEKKEKKSHATTKSGCGGFLIIV